jgi:mediator of RNA polymerase II transcription subunit 12
MRSHKRKGQAGTITWVRGWTSSVEQFLEAIIAAIGREEWKPRITYALRLVTNLYREYLLEGEHFLDWILKSLDTSSSERLFIWLLVASVYWKDLIETRRRGRRLAESLLCQAEKLSQLDDGDNNSPIQGFMNNVLANLIISSPSSLLLPKVWDKYKGLLHRVAEARPDRDMARRLADLNRRNRRLMSRTSKLSPETDSSSQTFLSLLDSVDYRSTIHIEALCSQCMELLSDTQILISKALHWASSIYREGAHRVYLVIRLLRRWNRLGFDTDSGILSFLRSMGTRKDIDIRNISKIVAELVRSKTFSVGKYLQWLIATGSLNANQDLMEPTAWPVRLLTEIPLSGLPVEIRNLRNTLLQGSGFSAAAEERMFNLTQESIKQHIPNLFDMATLVDHPPEINTANLSSTIRLELSVWLRQQVAENVEMVEQVSSKHTSSEEDTPVSTISVSDFYAIRSYIEDVGDISILADIVGIVSTSMDYAVLAALADTLHYHYKSLSAIGALKPLFQKVISRYTSLRNLRFPDREYVLSLLDLARTAKADSQLVQLLQDDLIRCDQRSAIAACSPVSDNMGEAAHTGLEGDDEIDRILSSGTSMDQQIMSRVFSKISSRLERQVSKGSTSPDSCASWFHRLRSFEDKAFDKLVSEWISSLLMNLQGKVMLAALPPLVTSGCFTFSQFVELSRRSIESRKASSDDGVVRMCVEALNALLPSDNLNRLCPSYDAYRYRLQQRKFCQESNGEVLAFIREAIGTCASQSSGIDAQISGLIASNRLRSIIRYFAIYDRKSLDEVFGIESSSAEAVSSCMKSLLDGLLDPSGSLCLADSTIENQVTNVVNAADELSLPFCQLELRHIFSVNPPQSEAYNAASNALLDSIKTAVEEDQPSWSELVAGLDNDLNTKIREHAEREILNGSAFLTSSKDTTSRTTESDDKAFIQRYLTVINSTASDTRPDGQSQTFTTLVERLRSTVEALGKTTDPASVQSSVATVTLPGERFCIWLNALLELSVIQIALPIAKTPNQTQAAFLWCLRSLFTHSSLQAFPSMMEFAFDIATVFSDIISEEVRNHLMKLDNAKTLDDARCAFIFGSGPPLDGWLGLVKSPTTSMVPQATPSQSQSPSAMPPQNQQPYQNPQFNSPSPVPLHRSLSQQQQQQAQARMYPQYNQQPQHSQHKQMLPQFPRMNSAPQQNPQMQPTPTQQMQMNFAQQRAGAPSPIAGQRQLPSQPSTPQSVSQPAGTAAKAGLQRQDKPEVRPIPFSLRRWEIIPESGGNGSGNETALSLSLFGARKV